MDAALRSAWNEKGFFVMRGLVSPADTAAIEDEVIAQIRAYPPERYPGEYLYSGDADYAIFPEKEPSPSAINPEDKIAKVFNCHTEGMTRTIAESDAIADVVADILGPDIDCFQSQFIFKNPGVIGQPWHQDSYYFRFNMQPQVGVWVALSRATLENGCLWVLPGSHKGPIHEHIPDRRPAANRAYMEIVSENDSTREPSLMEPGDVLFFHSYLMHMSTDNVANERRAAMVYHYGRTGTAALTPEIAASLTHVHRWIPHSPKESRMTTAAYTLHSRNQDFAWHEGREGGLRRVTPEQKRQFDEDGYFILKNAFTAEELAEVEAAIDPLEREHDKLVRANGSSSVLSSADAIAFTVHIVKKSPVLKKFAAHKAIGDVCHDLMGDDVRLYWDQSVYKKSGKPQEFPWHQDNGYTFVEPQQYLTFWIPLLDVDVENGCPWIAPGMHHLGTLKHWRTPIGLKCLEEVPDAVPAAASLGDVIVFSSLAPHRTGPNLKQGTVRKAYILQYAPDGAEAVMDDGKRIPQSDPDRQFPILQNGKSV